MDPDSGVARAASTTLTALSFIVFLSGCHGTKETPSPISDKKDSTTAAANILKIPDSVSSKRTIYLTFDDGPNRGTGNVLKVLQEEDIPASMFLIGVQLHGSPGQEADYNRMLQNHLLEVDNHSFSHAHNHFDKFYKTPQNVIDDFSRCADSLHLTDRIVRTPGRNIWRTASVQFTDIKKCGDAADSLYKAGYTAMGWDVEWTFNNHLQLTKTPAQMLEKIDSFFSKKETRTLNHLVLLAHDQSFADSTDAASLVSFIKQLKADGRYRFDVVSKYPGLKN